MAVNPKQYSASANGSKACDLVHNLTEGMIFWVTSSGIFIKTDSRWLIFLSYELHPGPLTINVPAARHAYTEIKPGDLVKIEFGRLSHQDHNLVISAQHLNAWQPRPPAFPALPRPDLHKRLVSAAEHITHSDQLGGLTDLLPNLLPIPGQPSTGAVQIPHWYEKIRILVQDTNEHQSPASIIELLGTGPGLTPSGDDFIIGFLLAQSRWGHMLPAHENHDQFNQQIVSAAYQKTTTLSANLIECAAQGLADQRLISALDWLVSETPDDIQVIDDLLTWGSSSGGDAFVGFVAVLSGWISK